LLVEKEYVNWSKGINAKGQPIPDAAKDPSVDGALVGPGSATNWQPPTFSPQTGLFYVGTSAGLSLSYLTDTDERPEGYGFTGGSGSGGGRTALRAIDYKTGQARWIHDMQIGSQGLMSTAGHLLFGSDGTGNFIAFSTETGKILWHAGLQANPSNGPETFLLDGRQYIVVGAGDSLYAFTLNR
jgi:alcohol dehydrogenase (cytochrome c)